MKLVQKRFLKGKRVFEIAGDTIHAQIRTMGKEQTLAVSLAVLNPEPVVRDDCLEFRSRVKSDALLSLFLNSPDPESFDNFVDEVKLRAREEYGKFTGLRTGAGAEGLAANSYEDPPDFDEPAGHQTPRTRKPARPESIDSSIQMLQQYLEDAEIEPLLTALHALRTDPDNDSRLDQLSVAFDGLGPRQGAVLTYAPYIGILLSGDSFGE